MKTGTSNKKSTILILVLLITIPFSQVVNADPTPEPIITPSKSPATSQPVGDVNSDNRVTIIDALMIAQYAVGNNPRGFNPLVADVNKSGKIDVVDALIVAQYYVGLLPGFP